MNKIKIEKCLLISVLAAGILAITSTPIIGVVDAEPQADPSRPQSSNDWGEVISGRAHEEQGIGEHSSNPFPGNDPEGTPPQDIDRETPRGGVGNQEPGKHPALHAERLCTQFPTAAGCSNIDPNDASDTGVVGGS